MKRALFLLSFVLFLIAVHASKARSLNSVIIEENNDLNYKNIIAHPRLLLLEGEEERIIQMLAKSSGMRSLHDQIIDECNKIITEPPVARIKVGKRLLAVSRLALQRIFALSYAYRIEGDVKYAERAEKEMLTVCAFNDWNPTHFLDVGEMIMAIAIGYDWLYDYLSVDTKKIVREAIIRKGFDATKNSKHAWFYEITNNWNQVCNAGLVFGAIAIFEDTPTYAQHIINKAIKTNPIALECYAPDGGYPEGFGYWGYGTSFQVLMIDALERAFEYECSISKAPGFLQSAEFIQFMSAPSGKNFSFSDTGVNISSNPMLWWFAGKTSNTSLLWLEKQYLSKKEMNNTLIRLLPSIPIFASRLDIDQIEAPKKNFWFSRGETPVFIYREGWNSKNDTYLGIKGGSPYTSHAHMDAGSFIYEKNGVRWSMDFGMQNYHSLEKEGINLWDKSQNSERWEVFRLRNTSHSTLTINRERHLVKSNAVIIDTFACEKKKGAIIDLSSTLENGLKKAIRSITLDENDNLTITDKLETSPNSVSAMWVMVTPAKVKIISEKEIELNKDGKRMILTVIEPSNAKLKIWSNESEKKYDAPNPGSCRVGFEVALNSNEKVTLHVELKEK